MLSFRGHYLVDPDTGNVYGGHPLGSLDGSGYLHLDGRCYGLGNLSIARVVWEAANGPIADGMQVNHINGVKTDNRIANLELVTPKENTHHAFATGLRSGLKGEKHHQAKLTEADVHAIRLAYNRYSRDVNARALAVKYGVTRKCIADVVIGNTWRHVAVMT